MRVQAGVVGGTKTLLQITARMNVGWQVLAQARYENRDYDDFESLLARFIGSNANLRSGLDSACLAVAGPVYGEAVSMTNVDWTI